VSTYFADTSFGIALARKRDQYHQRAMDWYQFILRNNSRLVTTEAVLWEWLNAFSDTSTRALAAEGYRRTHADPRIEVVAFQPELIAASVELYRTRGDKDWSLTDCLSFAVMTQRGLIEALTTDKHFEQAKLIPLRLSVPTH
jgi:predicted nucleic acid-binding protein